MISDVQLKGRYLDLLKAVLTGMIYEDPAQPMPWWPEFHHYDWQTRVHGNDWPARALTMIGLTRLQNVQDCAEQALVEGVPGDFAEMGVWRGGVCIFLRAVLDVYGVTDRCVWAGDSFQGLLAKPAGHEPLAVPEAEVRHNFELYGMLDDQVKFIPGWFHESLPQAPIEQLALLRLDGDHYIAQMAVLENLYPKVSPGGFVIVDDYPYIAETKQAVDEYRARTGIVTPIQQAGAAGWWRKR